MLNAEWWWYFGGSLLDALIGPNLFFPGEPFLLAAGYLLNEGAVYGVLSVLAGGLIGDQLSYFIGRKLGAKGRRTLSQRIPKTRRPFARAKLVLKKSGPLVVAAARLLGPVAWITPFLVGSYTMPWMTFTMYSLIGLILGVGQFVLLGLFLAQGIQLIPDMSNITLFLKEHSLLAIAIMLASTISIFLYRSRSWKKWLKISFCWLSIMGSVNYIHFFVGNAYAYESKAAHNDNIELKSLDYAVYPGLAPVYKAQPINIVIKGNTPQDLMGELGWIENKTFSRNDLNFTNYISLISKNLPPISDLYWNQQPQWSAYQKAGDLINRKHIRWWYAGREKQTEKDIWVGSVSYDNDLKLAHYKGIITILHAIDPDIDKERDDFANKAKSSGWDIEYKQLGSPVAYSKSRHYFSDGQVILLSKKA